MGNPCYTIDGKNVVIIQGFKQYFAGAEQSRTRTARIEKAMPAIFAGRGFLERR